MFHLCVTWVFMSSWVLYVTAGLFLLLLFLFGKIKALNVTLHLKSFMHVGLMGLSRNENTIISSYSLCKLLLVMNGELTCKCVVHIKSIVLDPI